MLTDYEGDLKQESLLSLFSWEMMRFRKPTLRVLNEHREGSLLHRGR